MMMTTMAVVVVAAVLLLAYERTPYTYMEDLEMQFSF